MTATPARSSSTIDLASLLYLGAVWGAVWLFMRIAAPQDVFRIEKQLRRYMSRLKDHKVEDSAEEYVENAAYTIFSAAEAANDEEAGFPAIVAETRVDIPEASVSDAVMLMDLRNTTALLFKNSGTGQFNMIYRREDGNIGWVEPNKA